MGDIGNVIEDLEANEEVLQLIFEAYAAAYSQNLFEQFLVANNLILVNQVHAGEVFNQFLYMLLLQGNYWLSLFYLVLLVFFLCVSALLFVVDVEVKLKRKKAASQVTF